MASPLDNKDPEWVRLDKLELYKTRLAKIKACTVPAVLASLLMAKPTQKNRRLLVCGLGCCSSCSRDSSNS